MLPLLLACVPDPWTVATEACSRSEEACTDHLRQDFGVGALDEEALAAFDAGARVLLTWELGPWPPEPDPLVHAPLEAMLEGATGADTRQRVYNFTASSILSLSEDEALDAYFRYRDGDVLTDGTPFDRGRYAATLVHEAAHAAVPGHRECADGADCDQSWEGAYAMEAATAHLAWEREADPTLVEELDETRCRAWRRVWPDGEEPWGPCPG